MSTYRLGAWAAGAMVIIGVLYMGALTAGFLGVGFDKPIGDPALAIMEVLTLLSAPAMVIAIAVVHQHASPVRKVYGVIALAFTIIFAGITSTVHFVELTASRQLAGGSIVWPSPSYAAELLAWDWFLGMALVSQASCSASLALSGWCAADS